MSRQIAPYRAYCPACYNYRVLHRYAAQYFCSPCSRKIAHLMRLDQSTSIDQVVEAIQQASTGERVTRWEHQAQTKRWRHVHHFNSLKRSNRP